MAYDKPYTPRPNTGSLFVNKVKKTAKSPDYQGGFLVNVSDLEIENGQAKIKLSGWKKVAPSGMTYLSLALDTWKPDPNYQKSEQPQQRQPAAGLADMEDDIPF